MAADQGSEVLDGEPGDGQAGLDGGLYECLGEVRLSRAGGSADAEVRSLSAKRAVTAAVPSARSTSAIE